MDGAIGVREAMILNKGLSDHVLFGKLRSAIVRTTPLHILSLHHDKKTNYLYIKVRP